MTQQDEEICSFQNDREQKRQALRKWKKQHKFQATYRALIDAAKTTHNTDLEEGVKYMEKKPEGNVTLPTPRIAH